MVRTALLFAIPALLIASSWLQAEAPRGPHVFAIVVLALLPALARSTWARALASALSLTLAVRLAFGTWIGDARPFDDRAFFGPAWAAARDGFLGFWDVGLPFAWHEKPLMHGIVLLAVFAFCLWTALALAARRPLLAAAAVVVGAAWPATLVSGGNEIGRGAAIFAAVLLILVGSGRSSPRLHRQAAFAGAALVVAAVAASTQPAVAKNAFLGWQGWDAYDAPDVPVNVEYVWDANYDGISFPEKTTTVLHVRGPKRPLYWRATTLDRFAGHRWVQQRRVVGAPQTGEIDLTRDSLLPAAALDERKWVSVEVTVEALRGRHVIGPATPVQYRTGNLPPVRIADGGIGIVFNGLRRENRYGVSSYVPEPKPAQLARSRAEYPPGIAGARRFLDLGSGQSAPPFGAPGREARMEELFARAADLGLEPTYYQRVYRRAREVVGTPRTPYAAVVALERWFRSTGGFAYDEQPRAAASVPALYSFVMSTKRGYCQHFAGAMALMLRYLGIPARVAAGFTSGDYDDDTQAWKVTDHDAHTWVEVWFKGYGWLPFDPTPGRGRLSAAYTASSSQFRTADVLEALQSSGGPLGTAFAADIARLRLGEELRVDNTGRGSSRSGEVVEKGGSLLALVALLGAGLVVLIALTKLVVRRARYLTRDPHGVVRACRAELGDFLRDQKIDVPESATLAELGTVLERDIGVRAARFVAAASEARYGPPGTTAARARRARRELGALRRELRRHLSATDRLRGLVSVRSLGLSG